MAKRGAPTRAPQAARTATAWSAMRTLFLRLEVESIRSKEIPVWVFGARLRQKFGQAPEGVDPPLLRLHRTARGEWQLLLTAWARDKVVASNQPRVDLNEFGCWTLERREVFSGPSAVAS